MKRTVTFLMLLLMSGAAMAQGEFVCGDTVRDGNGNEYATVRIGALCWTKSNMRAVSYADGTPIAKAMIYNSERYNDTVSNLANFGRLYSWWSAVNVPEGDDTKPEKDTAGFVQGVCPEGWHIPTVEEMNDLRNNPEEDLHSTDFWVLPNANTNSTGFSEVPGGKFSAELNRFEGLYTNSYMWTDSATSSEWVVACNSRYFCNKASEESVRKGDGLSVRCVKPMPTLELIGPSDTIVCAEGAVAVTYLAEIKNADISRYTFAWKVNGVDSSATGSTLTVNYTVDDTATSPHLIECQTVSRIPMTAEVSTNLSLQEASEVKMLHSICYPYKLIVQYQILNYDSTDLVESGIIYATKSDMSDAVSITADIKPDTNGIFTIETVLDGYNVCDTTWFTAWYSGRCVSGVSCDTLFEKVVPDPTDCGTVTDVDGNVYNTVKHGDMCWMKENLRTKHFRDGSPITRGMDYATDTSSVNPFYYMPTAEEVPGYDFETYGLYYNFPATSEAKGICPEGWHVPSMGEWDKYSQILSTRCEYVCGESSNFGKTMASSFGWKELEGECVIGANVATNNSSGFSAIPSGYLTPSGFKYVGEEAAFQTNAGLTTNSWYIYLTYSYYNGFRHLGMKYYGMPIRCLKNDTVVCSTTDAKPCSGTPTVSDLDGNVYNTVQIGHQCWTKENMRATTLPSGRELTSPDSASYTTPHYYNNTASTIQLEDRGLLYNWMAAMDTVFADGDNRDIHFENRRGICPEGWHVPNAAEWTALEEYLRTQKGCYDCDDNERNIAKSLASTSHWKNSTKACAVGNNSLDNDATGFKAIPVGQYDINDYFDSDGEDANFWSSTGAIASTGSAPSIYRARNFYLWYDFSTIDDAIYYIAGGKSVRCIKNNPIEDGQPCPGVPTVTDIDGNIYNTVQIGSQCWTKENLRTTKFRNGEDIPRGLDFTVNKSDKDPYFYQPDTLTDLLCYTLETYGHYYNYPAAVDLRKICPEGWHMPSDDDWTTLGNYVSSQTPYICGGSVNNIAKSLASKECWVTTYTGECTISFNTDKNDTTGFSAIPAGILYNIITEEKASASFWSTMEFDEAEAWGRALHSTNEIFERLRYRKDMGMSIRCLKGEEPTTTCPTVTTGAAAATADNDVALAGTVANITGTVEANGFVYGESKGALTSTKANEGSSDESLEATITGLTSCDTIWYAAFTKTSDCDDYVYGDTMWFKVPAPDITTCGKVKDHQENEYSTVKIGTQCWMAENMRCTTSPKGIMQKGTTQAVFTTPYYFETLSTTIPSTVGGHFYNWQAAMDTSFTAEEDISFTNRRGICPVGWHIPSEDDWNTLINYVSSQSDCYACGGDANQIAKSLASKEYWKNNNKECNVGNKASSTNNATGFNVIPTGLIAQGMMIGEGTNAYFWSSTSVSATTVVTKVMAHNSKIMDRGTATKVGVQSVRCVKDEEPTATCPTVTTGAAAATADNDVALAGTVANITGTVEANGFVYGESKSALTSTKDNEGSSDESLEATISGATPCDTIWYAAFTKTSDCDDYVYGDTMWFKVPAPDTTSCGTAMDHEGNTYKTVKIGTQCWMAENLRTTTSPSTKTNLIPADSVDYTFTGKQARWYDNDSTTYAPMKYGLLYNWNAAVDTFNTTFGELSVNNDENNAVSVTFTGHRRGICPTGWHVPSDAEWNTLTTYVGSRSNYTCGGDSNNIAKALADTTGWVDDTNQCAVGHTRSDNNKTGFSAVPAGYYYLSSFYFAGVEARFWTSTQNFSSHVRTRYLRNNMLIVGKANYAIKNMGYSVRCVKDEDGSSAATMPTVTTAAVSNVTAITATCGGNVTSDGGDNVTARGVCWSISPNPTIDSAHTTDGTGTGSFSSNITGLTASTTYYVRAYATNSEGTAYGNEVSFTTQNGPCPGAPTVIDVDSNVYNTVKIGNQCWMKENLRTTKYADGSTITAGGDNVSNTERYYYDYTSSRIDLKDRGLLYNWAAAMNGANSSNAVPSNVQGICPDGWHLPSNAEWDTLTNYVSSIPEYRCNDNNGYIAKALANITGWQSYNSDCAVGKDLSTNNATGFTAVPTGYYNGSAFNGARVSTFFWSSTEYGSDNAWYRMLYCSYASVSRYNSFKYDGFSVRCVKDVSTTPTVVIDSLSCPEAKTVTDYEGNTYATVKIGEKCWMRQNMRATKYADGTAIAAGGNNISDTEPYYYDYTESGIDLKDRGYFYNWAAVMNGAVSSNAAPSGVQGICPTGWHVPSDAEWNMMEKTVSGSDWQDGYANTLGYRGSHAGKLAGGDKWVYSSEANAPGNTNYTDRNKFGFSAVPAGICFVSSFSNVGFIAIFWSSTQNDDYYAWYRNLYYDDAQVVRDSLDKVYGFSVRCVKDEDGVPFVVDCTPVGDAKPCPGTPIVYDHEGNEYNTVQIGKQCWTKENMRCTTSPSGKTAFQAALGSSSYVSPQYYDSESSIPLNDRGLLYNWAAAMDTVFTSENEMNVSFINRRGICPEGWHVPTDYEWNVFENYVNSQDCYQCDDEIGFIAKALSSTKYWKEDDYMSCIVGNDLTKNNATGFSAVPAGMCRFPNYYLDSMQVSFWSSTSASEYGAYFCNIMSHERVVTREAGNDKNTGYSVRCIKNDLDGNPCPGAPTVIDADSNVYNTVRIGNQCWMKENLRTTKYADGSTITAGGNNESSTERYYYDYTTSGIDSVQRGYLYNWAAVMNGAESSNAAPSGVQGICPTGWHVPSYSEWMVLLPYLNSQNRYLCERTNELLAKSLASSTGWNSNNNQCAVGNNQSTNNFTGFSAVPAGYYDGSTLLGAGECAEFWSSTQVDNDLARYLNLYYDHAKVNRGQCNKNYANSVRCVKDVSTIPTVSTAAVSNITDTSATCGGNVTSDGGDNVTARGVCWSISPNPTIDSAHTTDGTGTGSFSSNITGLTASTTYYVRAYAANSEGTAYGNEVSFTTQNGPCPGAPTVIDADSNVYNTVRIGNQCWMKENLRTKHYADGTEIPAGGSNTSSIAPYYYNYTSDIDLEDRGYLYNWPAATRNTSSSLTTGVVQGICPNGWHVPSDAEWDTLMNYVGNQNEYKCSDNSGNIAKALATATWWRYSDNTCATGNDQSKNNYTGFSAVPAGYYDGSFFVGVGDYAEFWSSTQYNSNNAYDRFLFSAYGVVNGEYITKNYGFSVRCLKDEAITATVVIDEKSCSEAKTVTDHEGNVYATVQIGDQCWMRDNMRATTSPSTGTYIVNNEFTSGSNIACTYTGKMARWYDNDSATYAPMKYGLLYNWNAAVDTFNTAFNETNINNSDNNAVDVSFTGHRRGICPEGWHLPTGAEWTTLRSYVSSQPGYLCNGNFNNIAKALADSVGWYSATNVCRVGYNQNENNATGFSANPAGYYTTLFTNRGSDAAFWTATQNNSILADYRKLTNTYVNIYVYNISKANGYSVRCLKDN